MGGSVAAPARVFKRRRTELTGEREWTDGPFTESRELVAGFSFIEVTSQDVARTRPGRGQDVAEAYAAILGDNEVDVRRVADQP